MIFDFEGKHYEFVYGSDVINDGMYLEASEVNPESNHVAVVLFAFRPDDDERVTFSAYREDLPLALVEEFVKRVRQQLRE